MIDSILISRIFFVSSQHRSRAFMVAF